MDTARLPAAQFIPEIQHTKPEGSKASLRVVYEGFTRAKSLIQPSTEGEKMITNIRRSVQEAKRKRNGVSLSKESSLPATSSPGSSQIVSKIFQQCLSFLPSPEPRYRYNEPSTNRTPQTWPNNCLSPEEQQTRTRQTRGDAQPCLAQSRKAGGDPQPRSPLGLEKAEGNPVRSYSTKLSPDLKLLSWENN